MQKQLLHITRTGLPTLGLWRMTPPAERLPPVLLVHGATYGAAIFDLARPGYSLMHELATDGRAVYALDVRGFGASMNVPAMNAPAMNAPAIQNPPFARAQEAKEDIASAVRFIRDASNADSIDLVGFSWGTITASLFTQFNAPLVRRLALYAPLFGERNELWLKRIGSTDDSGRLAERFGAYRLISLNDTLQRWDDDLHGAAPSAFREAGVAELLFNAQAALDVNSENHTPRAFRCPNGALADLIEIFNGKPIYDPSALEMPLLLVRGERDTTATESDAKRLMARLPAARVKYRSIPGGSHFLCIEKNRLALYEELRSFLSC